MELVTIRITRGPLTHRQGPAHLENRPGGQGATPLGAVEQPPAAYRVAERHGWPGECFIISEEKTNGNSPAN